VLASAVAQATIGAIRPSVYGSYTGSFACDAFDIRNSLSTRNFTCEGSGVSIFVSSSGSFGQPCAGDLCMGFDNSTSNCGFLTIRFAPASFTGPVPGGGAFAGTRQNGSTLETIAGTFGDSAPLSLSMVTEAEQVNSLGVLQSHLRCQFTMQKN